MTTSELIAEFGYNLIRIGHPDWFANGLRARLRYQGVYLSEKDVERFMSLTDKTEIEFWVRKALSVRSAEEIFGSEPSPIAQAEAAGGLDG
ncbi:hypothetical protein [Nonomuraea indica]|uniref:hypothetical protein n=1 Tax=Nonomuraea indica TaxID=1581193 RepID=UPI000C7CBCAD|nr:hypothetical protein [Nonomuraea indica]